MTEGELDRYFRINLKRLDGVRNEMAEFIAQ
jgi:hypothetical protein